MDALRLQGPGDLLTVERTAEDFGRDNLDCTTVPREVYLPSVAMDKAKASIETYIDKATAEVRKNIFTVISRRPLYVMYESALGCDPAYDHEEPKDVLPIFARSIKQCVDKLRQDLSEWLKDVIPDAVRTYSKALSDGASRYRDALEQQRERADIQEEELKATQEQQRAATESFSRDRKQLLKEIITLREQLYGRGRLGEHYKPDFGPDKSEWVSPEEVQSRLDAQAKRFQDSFRERETALVTRLERSKKAIADSTEEMNVLRRKIKELEEEMNTMKASSETLVESIVKSKMEENEKELIKAQTERNNLQQELDLLRSIYEEEKSKNSGMSGKWKLQQKELADAQSRLLSMEKDYKAVQEQYEGALKGEKLARSMMQKMELELNTLKAGQAAIENTSKARAAQITRLEALVKSLSTKKASNENESDKNKKGTTSESISEKAIQTMQEKISKAKEKLKGALESSKSMGDYEKEISQLKTDFQNERNKLLDEFNKKQTESSNVLSSLKNRIAELERLLKEATENNVSNIKQLNVKTPESAGKVDKKLGMDLSKTINVGTMTHNIDKNLSNKNNFSKTINMNTNSSSKSSANKKIREMKTLSLSDTSEQTRDGINGINGIQEDFNNFGVIEDIDNVVPPDKNNKYYSNNKIDEEIGTSQEISSIDGGFYDISQMAPSPQKKTFVYNNYHPIEFTKRYEPAANLISNNNIKFLTSLYDRCLELLDKTQRRIDKMEAERTANNLRVLQALGFLCDEEEMNEINRTLNPTQVLNTNTMGNESEAPLDNISYNNIIESEYTYNNIIGENVGVKNQQPGKKGINIGNIRIINNSGKSPSPNSRNEQNLVAACCTTSPYSNTLATVEPMKRVHSTTKLEEEVNRQKGLRQTVSAMGTRSSISTPVTYSAKGSSRVSSAMKLIPYSQSTGQKSLTASGLNVRSTRVSSANTNRGIEIYDYMSSVNSTVNQLALRRPSTEIGGYRSSSKQTGSPNYPGNMTDIGIAAKHADDAISFESSTLHETANKTLEKSNGSPSPEIQQTNNINNNKTKSNLHQDNLSKTNSQRSLTRASSSLIPSYHSKPGSQQIQRDHMIYSPGNGTRSMSSSGTRRPVSSNSIRFSPIQQYRSMATAEQELQKKRQEVESRLSPPRFNIGKYSPATSAGIRNYKPKEQKINVEGYSTPTGCKTILKMIDEAAIPSLHQMVVASPDDL